MSDLDEGASPTVYADNVSPRIQKVELYGHTGYMYIGKGGKGVFAYRESGTSGSTNWEHVKVALVKRDGAKVHLRFRHLSGPVEKAKQRHQLIVGVDLDLVPALSQCVMLCLNPNVATAMQRVHEDPGVAAERARAEEIDALMKRHGTTGGRL